MAERKLTPKQEAFVREYLTDLNAAGAYRRAGYKARTDHVASVNAAALMAKHGIAAAIQAKQQARSARTEISQDWVLTTLQAEAQDHTEAASHAARIRALELLGKHLGLFKDKIEASVDLGEIDRLISLVSRSLDPFPDARLALAQILLSFSRSQSANHAA